MSNVPALTTPLYCTDEDLVSRCGADFLALAPGWQQTAYGLDGAFISGSPWVLTSTLTNFAANSIQPNQVVWLSAPKVNFPGGGTLMAIDSVAAGGGSVTLRRIYQDLSIGNPPAPAAGLTGVTFTINTLSPQIATASFDIKRRFGIDETIVDRQSTWVFDLQDLRLATVLTVLVARYTQEARGDRGDFPHKIGLLKSELANVLDRVQVRWGPLGNSEPSTTLFSCRLVR